VADGVHVDTDGLNKFSDQVQNDTTSTLESGYSRASVDLSLGGGFGANNASGSVWAAKERYRLSLKESTANIERYVEAAKILADTASKVAKSMDDSDGRAASRAAEMRYLLQEAVTESQKRMAASAMDGHPTTRTTEPGIDIS
jgi:hypothetical protein